MRQAVVLRRVRRQEAEAPPTGQRRRGRPGSGEEEAAAWDVVQTRMAELEDAKLFVGDGDAVQTTWMRGCGARGGGKQCDVSLGCGAFEESAPRDHAPAGRLWEGGEASHGAEQRHGRTVAAE